MITIALKKNSVGHAEDEINILIYTLLRNLASIYGPGFMAFRAAHVKRLKDCKPFVSRTIFQVLKTKSYILAGSKHGAPNQRGH